MNTNLQYELNINKFYTKKKTINKKNKLIVFTNKESKILKEKKPSQNILDNIKSFKKIFDCIIIS